MTIKNIQKKVIELFEALNILKISQKYYQKVVFTNLLQLLIIFRNILQILFLIRQTQTNLSFLLI